MEKYNILEEIRCGKCNSRWHRYRMKTHEMVCLKCGNVWQRPEDALRVSV